MPAPRTATPRLIDRVVAVVNNRPILESDIRLARLCRLVPGLGQMPPAEARSKLVEARVRLEVQYQDLMASGTIYRLRFDAGPTYRDLLERAGIREPDLHGRIVAPRGRVERLLAASGLTLDDVHDLAVRIAAVNAYVTERLRPQVRVTLPELRIAYQQILALQITARGAAPPPLSQVRSRLRQVVVERKLNSMIAAWTAQARERLDVMVLYP